MQEMIKEKLLDILNHYLVEAEITMDQLDNDLTKLGMDSILFIHIIVALEETFECEIPDSKLMITEMNTPQKIIDVLKGL